MLFDGLETRFGSLSPVQLLALSVLIALPIWLATRSKADPREPLEIKPKIPVIGHLINLMRRGLSYYTDLRYGKESRYDSPPIQDEES
jgi:hypothetical protein